MGDVHCARTAAVDPSLRPRSFWESVLWLRRPQLALARCKKQRAFARVAYALPGSMCIVRSDCPGMPTAHEQFESPPNRMLAALAYEHFAPVRAILQAFNNVRRGESITATSSVDVD